MKRLLNPELLTFIAGLLLFGVGLGLAWLPLGLIGPGLVLMLISLVGDRDLGGTKP